MRLCNLTNISIFLKNPPHRGEKKQDKLQFYTPVLEMDIWTDVRALLLILLQCLN